VRFLKTAPVNITQKDEPKAKTVESQATIFHEEETNFPKQHTAVVAAAASFSLRGGGGLLTEGGEWALREESDRT
jgi:hypothetical protein